MVGRVVVSAHRTRGCLPSRRPGNEVKGRAVRALICEWDCQDRRVAVKRGLKCKKGPTVALTASMFSLSSSDSLKQTPRSPVPLRSAPPFPLGKKRIRNLISELSPINSAFSPTSTSREQICPNIPQTHFLAFNYPQIKSSSRFRRRREPAQSRPFRWNSGDSSSEADRNPGHREQLAHRYSFKIYQLLATNWKGRRCWMVGLTNWPFNDDMI